MRQTTWMKTRQMATVGSGAHSYLSGAGEVDWPIGHRAPQAVAGFGSTRVPNGSAVRLEGSEGSSG